jgi:transcriptional regulator with XRE-family HTH domain
MRNINSLEYMNKTIASGVRALRRGRRLSQVQLAAQLGVSQGRLSELERGDGSFTAEQLLLMLKLFNVTVSYFAPPTHDHDAKTQNALARLGAAHLRESDDVLPSEDLDDVGDVVREVLLAGSSRHMTALAPVLVRNIDRVNLRTLRVELAQAGLERRLAWLVDNTLEAVRCELRRSPPRSTALRYRRAEAVLEVFSELALAQAQERGPLGVAERDLLDPTIRSTKTRRDVAVASSPISQRWGIITSIQPEDFVEALRAAHVH